MVEETIQDTMFGPVAKVIRNGGMHKNYQDQGLHIYILGLIFMGGGLGVVWVIKTNVIEQWGWRRASMPSAEQRWWQNLSKRDLERPGGPY